MLSRDEKEVEKMVGRPLKLTKQVISEMSKHIEDGSSYKDAAALVGVHYNSFLDWRKRGEEDQENGAKSIFVDFLCELREAEARGKAEAIKYIKNNDDWRAKAWYLERKYNDEFGNKQKIEHSGDEEKPIRVKLKWD